MSADAFSDGVAGLLVGDATFAAAISALLLTPVTNVLRSNMPFAEIPGHLYPCFVIEQGNGQAEVIDESGDDSLTIGNYEQQFASDLVVVVLWSQADRETAAAQRARLPKLIAQLFLRNPCPGGITSAWLQEWQPDRAANHPTQIWQASLRGQYAIPRT